MSRPPVRTVEHRPAADGLPPLEVVRSRRRRRSATAFARDGVVVVQLPAGLARVEEQRLITSLVKRVVGASRAEAVGGDDELWRRAVDLADRYLDGVRPSSVTWSRRMTRRYGSCSTDDGRIRISQVLAAYPSYVLDAVIVHELAHLLVPDHSPRFKALVERYPEAQRARGFLEGIALAAARARLPEGHDALPPVPVDTDTADLIDGTGRPGSDDRAAAG